MYMIRTQVGYDTAYLFAYSERGKTAAARKLPDDVPEDVKLRRLDELISTFRSTLAAKSQLEVRPSSSSPLYDRPRQTWTLYT